MATSRVAFVGLGVMGFPMAGHLAKAGHEVSVYNRTFAKAEEWAGKHGGKAMKTPAEAAKGADIVFSCVGNDDDVRSVVYGDAGIFAGIAKDPVSGGQAGAENGALTVMCGGDQAAFDRAEAAMRCYGRAVTLMGEPGAGQLTKMVNQICIAGLVQALSEGMNFGMKAGLDCNKVLDVISKGAAQSWQMENRGRTMIEGKFDFGFAVNWMRKDLGICLEEAKSNGARLPVTALVDQFYAHVQERGGGRWDTSALIHLLMNK
jgi:3-hydroxyisobutyrate dehydrogenase-like beta-hydroxyacid dehydrogenase